MTEDIQYAYPMHEDLTRTQNMPQRGMTLRDYFAAEALKGLLSNSGGPIQHNPMSGWHFCNCKMEDVTGMAYEFADSMLLERVK